MIAHLSVMIGLAALLPTNQDAECDEFCGKMLGTYAIEGGQRGEERLSDEELEGTVRITRDRMSLHRADGGEIFAARFKVDEVDDRSAKLSLETVKLKADEADELETESEGDVGSTGKALATLDEGEGRLSILYDMDGDEYPDDLKPDHEGQHLFVLKKKSDIEE